MKKKILITGAGGQVGSEFRELAEKYEEFDFIFTTRDELQIGDKTSVQKFFTENKIDFCVNCAAYTAVDKSEINREEAKLINVDAVGFLAEECRKQKATFIHLSTDYVFDGSGKAPYRTTDPVLPVNYYGQTKLLGEETALLKAPDCIIIRTSWVYSSYGNNFVKTMIRLMSERDEINVVNDQFGSPTNAKDLSEAIMKIITSEIIMPGIFHFSNSGVITWYEFAMEIKRLTGSICKVNAIDTVSYPTPAKRPHYSALDTSKISSVYGIEIKPWKESLSKCRLFQKN